MNIYDEVSSFYKRFSGRKCVFGKSVEGRELYAVFIGKDEFPSVISQYAIHGREWITALLALHHTVKGVKRGGVWILPLTNPDGALLSEVGISTVSPCRREELVALNGGYDFSLWKANAEGVDLNVNFDARWGSGRKNITFPAPENYIGKAPFSAIESRLLKEFTEKICPDYTVSWHSKGEEIYWKFHQPLLRALRDKKLARKLSVAVKCPLKEAKHSAGGYKDWCVETLKIPAFTVEIGSDFLMHPITRAHFPEIRKQYGLALQALNEGYHGRKVYARGNQTR